MFTISSCTSQNSTAIIFPNASKTSVAGERVLDGHSADKRRRSVAESTTKKPSTRPKNKTLLKTSESSNESRDNERKKVEVSRKSISKTSEVFKKAVSCNTSKAGVDYITPSLESSSRYLLGVDNDSSSLEVVLDSDPVLESDLIGIKPVEGCLSSATISSEQVIMLSVSLHCRACETKLKKHLSTISGVTSFKIDFAAKKVTVVGNVTPIQVLSSISKVKSAKLWSSSTMPSSYLGPKQLASN